MAQVINTNVASLNAQRNLNSSQSDLQTSLQRLSSGLRINSARDDAAGLAISERFTTQIRGLNQAARNASDGISLAQTGEGDLAQITNNLQRIRELAVQSANATNSSSDRAALQLETSELIAEIERVSSTSAFNGVNLLDGSFSSQLFQVGANAGETVSIDNISSARTSDIGQVLTASSTGTEVTAALSAGDLTINGNDVGAVSQDALAIANAITATDSNVSATATNAQTGIAFADVVGTAGSPTQPTTLSVSSWTPAQSSSAAEIPNQSEVSGSFVRSVASVAGQTYSITVDGVLAYSFTSTSGNLDIVAFDVDLGLDRTALNAAGITVTGSAQAGDLQFARSDTTAFDIVIVNEMADTPGGFTGAEFATGTNTIDNGSPAVVDNDFTMTLDGNAFYSEAQSIGGEVTGAELDGALATYLATPEGAEYSITSGSFATGDLLLSKADGSDITFAITSNFSAQAGALSPLVSTNGAAVVTAAVPDYTLSVDGNELDFSSAGADGTITASEVAGLINDLAGYTATAGSGTLDITKEDGSNIVLVEGGDESGAAEGLTLDGVSADATSTLYGQVTVTSTNVEELVIAGTAPGNAGLSVTTVAADLGGTTIANTDISTVAGANAAITSVDSALTRINTSRASLGAIQNRFESIVSSIETSVENLSSARSRIRDADFASETATLTRNQILQQAGVSILSQANSLPQLALSLLQ